MHNGLGKGIATSLPILEVQHANEDGLYIGSGLIKYKPLHY